MNPNLAGARIVGRRPYQEDEFRIADYRGQPEEPCAALILVADGMGGHLGGAKASRLAAEAFPARFAETSGSLAERLRAGLDQANHAIRTGAADASRGMGCTVVGAAIAGGALHWISVGDSPLWRLRGGDLRQLNEDHSMQPLQDEAVRSGWMTRDEAAWEYPSNQLRSAVMGGRLEMVDEGRFVELQPGDRIIAASDGLLTLSSREIAAIGAAPKTAREIVSDLLQAIEDRSERGQDNTTVIVYQHPGSAEPTG